MSTESDGAPLQVVREHLTYGTLDKELKKTSYSWTTTKISVPPTLLAAMSKMAQSFFWFLLEIPTSGDTKALRGDQLLAPWDPESRRYFAELEPEVQVEICACVCAISHEWIHHFDLLGTPFGANLHGKLCREYLAFQKWAPLLTQKCPDVFDGPLMDWLASTPAGPDAAQALVGSGPLGHAQVELRGPVRFYEVVHGAFPRHVTTGWGENTTFPTIKLGGDRQYEKITVNELWSTIRGAGPDGYLSPRDIVEGRAFVLNLLFIWHLVGGADPPDGMDALGLLRRYTAAYYEDSPRYTAALEVVAGQTVDDLLASGDTDLVQRELTTTAVITWYALQSPPPIERDDVLQGITARFLYAAKVAKDNDWRSFKDGPLRLLEGVDEHFAEVGSKPCDALLRQSVQVLELTRTENAACSAPEVRGWYEKVLSAIQRTLHARIGDGYWSPWGLAFSGNPIDHVDDTINAGIGQLEDAPALMTDWYELRALVLRKQGRREEKISQLRSWFSV
ncbi:hypothetical protein ACFQW6_07360 [Nocardioides sp. GCM10028917]|uniref:hypothetical protein n=1 Tax=Nocardioides sp. GCM10028917 TaxID=3273408 RepID=UPI00360A096F